MTKEYEVISVCDNWEDTQNKLNDYARKGWKLVCSYARGYWFVLEREFKERKE